MVPLAMVGGDRFFFQSVVDVHERRWIADVAIRLFVLGLEHFQHSAVAANHAVAACRGEVDDLRRAVLAVAVYAAIALREHHQRPRHVEVDEPVAVVVQVDALGGHIRTNDQAHRLGGVAEIFHHALLLQIRHAAVQRFDLIFAQFQILRQTLRQPIQRFDALGEDH